MTAPDVHHLPLLTAMEVLFASEVESWLAAQDGESA